MPLYDFRCDMCNKETELFKKLAEEHPNCPVCGRSMVRVMSPTHFVLNGSCWAKDNYGLKTKKKGEPK